MSQQVPYPNSNGPYFNPQQRQRPSTVNQVPNMYNYTTPTPSNIPQPDYNHYLQHMNTHTAPQAPRPMQQTQPFYTSNGFNQPSQPVNTNNGDYVMSAPIPSPPNSRMNVPIQPHLRPPQSQVPQQEFISQFTENPMAGLAMNTAQDFLQKQSELYLPGAYGAWGNIKYYFTVNNTYVKTRLKLILQPFTQKDWRRRSNQDTHREESTPKLYAPPSRDGNAPDLYIPFMSFLTYILIVGYFKGTSDQFSPDVIGKDASYCLVLQLLEIAVYAACLYLLNSTIFFLDLLSFSGYKYVPLVVSSIVYQVLGNAAYYISIFYTGIALSYFTLNCMKASVGDLPAGVNRSFRNYLLFGVSILQLVLVSWISYTTAPHS